MQTTASIQRTVFIKNQFVENNNITNQLEI